jgi:protoheme IX farnesyltransferase
MANVMIATTGYLFATQWQINWSIFVALIVGLTLVIASAGVLNNIIDRDLDRQMDRTKLRALASNKITVKIAVAYALLLGLIGFGVLAYTNWLTMAVVAIAFFFYIVIYSYAKRHSVHGTLIGTVPGGAPLVAGYVAATDALYGAALILFLIMLAWQMVHFYAIAIYRLKDYRAAKIPVLPVKAGIKATKQYMMAYLVLFVFFTTLLTWQGFTGLFYLGACWLLGAVWLQKLMKGFAVKNDSLWAQEIFRFSLVALLILSVLLAVGPILP